MEQEKKKRIRAKDRPEWVWDDEDTFKRFAITPYIQMQDDKDRKQFWEEQKKRSIDDLLKDKDYSSYEYVGEDEEVEPNNITTKSEYGEGNPYADVDKLLDEWDKEEIDTNDNGKVEVDELDAYTKDLEDYLEKNPKAKDKNYY